MVGRRTARSPWVTLRSSRAFRGFLRNRGAVVGGIMVLGIVCAAVAAPWIREGDPAAIQLGRALMAPTGGSPFGTDQLGRDILTRVLYGGRVSMLMGILAVSIALAGGVPLGLLAGFYGGTLDHMSMRVIEIMLAFPGFLLALLVVSVLGPGLWNAMVAVGIASVPLFTRLVRSSVLAERTREYVEASRVIGASNARIMVRHILPNVVSPLIVQSTLRVATAILTAAGLSFLGLGAQPPSPEWGAMVSQGRAILQAAPWVSFFPGVAIMVFVLGLNLVGDGLNDALNPRTKSRA